MGGTDAPNGQSRYLSYDFKTKKWTDLFTAKMENSAMSPDNKYLYFTTGGPEFELRRFRFDDHKIELITNIKDLPQLRYGYTQTNAAPDVSVVSLGTSAAGNLRTTCSLALTETQETPAARITESLVPCELMEFEIAPSTPSITTRHLLLLRKYFLVLQLIDRFPRIMWLPLFTSHWFRFIRIPVLRVAVRVVASTHIKRVVQALDRAYQLRLAIDQPTTDEDDWKKLHEQAESMDGGVRPFLISKWVVVSLAFVIVFLVGRSVPTGDFAITAKMVVAAVTLNPEKLAELAAEPGALRAFSRLVFGTLVLFIAFTPILIYHFRFKRTLFNSPVLLSTIEFKELSIATIWKQQSTSPESLYTLELEMFAALGQPALQEIPLDLLAIAVVFGYHAVGPGLVVGIIASQVYAVNRGAGRSLFYVAAINAAIGFFMVVWAMLQSASRQSIKARDNQPPNS